MSTDAVGPAAPVLVAIDGVSVLPAFEEVLAIDLKELDLSVRTRNVLQNAEIRYIGDLIKWDEKGLRRLPNCGTKTIDELCGLAKAYGLSLGKAVTGWTQPSENSEPPRIPSLADFDETAQTRLHLRIAELNLSVRATNALTSVGVEFIGDLVQRTEPQLRQIQNCGRTTIAELVIALRRFDFQLGMVIADWDQVVARETRNALDAKKNSSIVLLRRQLANVPKGASLEEELRGILKSVSNDKSVAADRNIEIIMKHLGWSGAGQRTLDSVGQDYSMTRERVRQITAREMRKIRKNSFETPWLDKALDTVHNLCPATAETLSAALQAEGISAGMFDPSGLFATAEYLDKELGLTISQIGKTKYFVRKHDASSFSAFFRHCRRLSSGRGCVNFEGACDELKIPASERAKYHALATTENICEWLDDEQRWLIVPRVPRNRLANLIGKILCVSPELRLPELRRALSRSRRLMVVPPAGIIARFVERLQLACISGDKITAAMDFSAYVEVGSMEETFVKVFRNHGPVIAWDRLREFCVAAGMNPITFGIYLSASPIIARLARGIYSLVGADVPPGLVEDVANQLEAARKPFEYGWTPRGTLWCALPQIGAALAFGAITIPRFVSDIAAGEWTPRLGEQMLDGSIKCNDHFLWGLRRALLNAGAERDDVCILEFDLSSRVVNLTLGDEELVDIWDSGENDLGVADSAELEETDGEVLTVGAD